MKQSVWKQVQRGNIFPCPASQRSHHGNLPTENQPIPIYFSAQLPFVNRNPITRILNCTPPVRASRKSGWCYLGNEKSYQRSTGVKTTRVLVPFQIFEKKTIENNNHNIHSDPSIKSDRGQHSQFLQCFKKFQQIDF